MGTTLEEIVGAAVEHALDRHLGEMRAHIQQIARSLPPRMLTVAQAAEAMGVHACTVRRMVAAGQLVYKRVGKAGVRIDASSIHGAGELGARRAAGGRR